MSTRTRQQIAVALVAIATCVIGVASTSTPSTSTAAVAGLEATSLTAVPIAAADGDELVVLRTERGGLCSAMPIRGTTAVVTAAHCLVNRSTRHHPVDGAPSVPNQAVYFEVGGVAVNNRVTWFTVHPTYFNTSYDDWGAYDVAVVYTHYAWPFGAMRVGFGDQPVVDLAAYGMQHIGADGYRLDRAALAEQSRRGLGDTPLAPARCSLPLDVFHTDARLVASPCGLVNGASGGPVLARTAEGDVQLVGVVSSITSDRQSNWFVTSDVVTELLEHGGLFIEPGVMPARIDLAPWEPIRRQMTP